MSMISEQVNKIRKVVSCVYLATDKEVADDIASALNQAADTIEALSAKLATANMERSDRCYGSGWITDREPEESGYYLVTYHEWSNGDFLPKFDDTYVKRLHYQKGEQFIGWNFPKCVDKRAEEDMNVEVLAWCYLPEPYLP